MSAANQRGSAGARRAARVQPAHPDFGGSAALGGSRDETLDAGETSALVAGGAALGPGAALEAGAAASGSSRLRLHSLFWITTS